MVESHGHQTAIDLVVADATDSDHAVVRGHVHDLLSDLDELLGGTETIPRAEQLGDLIAVLVPQTHELIGDLAPEKGVGLIHSIDVEEHSILFDDVAPGHESRKVHARNDELLLGVDVERPIDMCENDFLLDRVEEDGRDTVSGEAKLSEHEADLVDGDGDCLDGNDRILHVAPWPLATEGALPRFIIVPRAAVYRNVFIWSRVGVVI